MSLVKQRFQKIAFISDLINILFSIIAIPFSVVLFYVFKDGDFTYLQSIGFNWKSYPISSISLLNLQRGKCLETETQIIFDFWAGSTKGCDCTNSLFSIGIALTRGFCSRRQSGCISIPASPSSPLLFWRSGLFCKNKNTMNYFDLNIVQNPVNCPSGYRSCGLIDSINNFLCVDIKENCPINKLKFFSYDQIYSMVSTNNLNISNLNYNTTNLNLIGNLLLKDYIGYLSLDGGILAFSNLFTNNKILTQFKLSEGQPCLIPYFDNSRSARFILENNFYNSKCYQNKISSNLTYDERYDVIDSYSKISLYKQNGILNNFKYFINKSLINNEIPDFDNIISTYPQNKQTSYSIGQTTNETSSIYNSNNNQETNFNKRTTPSIENYYVNYLYNYDFNYNYDVDLFGRNFIGLNKRCFDEIKSKNLTDILLFHVSKIPIFFAIASDLCYYITISIITLATYNVVVYGVFYILKYTVYQADAVFYFDKFNYKILIILFPILISIIVNILIGYIRGIINNDDTPLQYLNNRDCVDPQTYEVLSDFYRRINMGMKFTFAVGSIIGINLLNIVAFFGLKFLKILKNE